ncbi:MAG: C-GCAxxG-C-C family protein [Verrucomicrobiae bacterium]|nr:C-GCAxxG-C-C family protein [Verrucomicrobiae bacterium]
MAPCPPEAWEYVPISPERAAEGTYRHYPGHGCMYAVFRGIVETWRETHGTSLQSFPYQMMDYGHGGVAGYGTLCGALNGAAAAVGLFEASQRVRDVLLVDLFKWYEHSSLPQHRPPDQPAVPVSVAGSVLCHASVARWCTVAQSNPYSSDRGERCRRLSADVTRHTVDLLNGNRSRPRRDLMVRDGSSDCMQCHAPKAPPATTVRTLMSCQSCHSVPAGHPDPSATVPARISLRLIP